MRPQRPLVPRQVVMQASGGYEGVIAANLADAALPKAIVGAESRAGQDYVIDARLTARFAEAIRSPPRRLRNALMNRLQELPACRRHLVIMINAEKPRFAMAAGRRPAALPQSNACAALQRAELYRFCDRRAGRAGPVAVHEARSVDQRAQGQRHSLPAPCLVELHDMISVERHQIAAGRVVRAGRVPGAPLGPPGGNPFQPTESPTACARGQLDHPLDLRRQQVVLLIIFDAVLRAIMDNRADAMAARTGRRKADSRMAPLRRLAPLIEPTNPSVKPVAAERPDRGKFALIDSVSPGDLFRRIRAHLCRASAGRISDALRGRPELSAGSV